MSNFNPFLIIYLLQATAMAKSVFVISAWHSDRSSIELEKALFGWWVTSHRLTHPIQKRNSNQYNTKLSKPGLSYLSNPESSSVTFNREGLIAGKIYKFTITHIFFREQNSRDHAREIIPDYPIWNSIYLLSALPAYYIQCFKPTPYCHM